MVRGVFCSSVHKVDGRVRGPDGGVKVSRASKYRIDPLFSVCERQREAEREAVSRRGHNGSVSRLLQLSSSIVSCFGRLVGQSSPLINFDPADVLGQQID